MILVLDNYDSFTYNLVHLIKELGYGDQLEIFRNDKISLEAVDKYDKILLSPGPGIPSEAGIMPELIKKYAPTKSIFGVCLGHQAIGEAFGEKLYNIPEVLHGFANEGHVVAEETVLFKGIPKSFKVGHYHSWTIHPDFTGEHLEITIKDDLDLIMGIQHKEYDVRGVQFHPESVLTEHGAQMLKNWLEN